jgi:hypothetical protein
MQEAGELPEFNESFDWKTEAICDEVSGQHANCIAVPPQPILYPLWLTQLGCARPSSQN